MKKIDGVFMVKALENALGEIENHEKVLNALNVFPVPDGDTGSNILAALREAYKRVKRLGNDLDLPKVMDAIKEGTLMGARGNSGVILSQIFRGLAEGLNGKTEANIADFAHALVKAKDVAYSAVIKPVEGTMLTVIRKVAQKALELSESIEDYEEFLSEISNHAMKVVEETPSLLPQLKEAGVVDAGAKGLYYVFEAFRKAALGESVKRVPTIEVPEPEEMIGETPPVARVEEDAINYTYCTELICRLNENGMEREIERGVREYLETIGDSIVLLVQSGLLKLHVHTDHPGDVIERVLKHGALEKVKIDNMRQQHHHVVDMVERIQESTRPRKRYGVVVVAPSPAIGKIFSELGADVVVLGGQTMNPSLADLKDAVDSANAETVFVFPNNSNIILTAHRLAELMDETKVVVIPTKSIQECIGALTRFDESLGEDELLREFEDGMETVVSISITYAVRDTKVNGKKIAKGEYIALVGDDIVAHGSDREEVTLESIEKALRPEHEIVTIVRGEGVDDKAVERLEKSLKEHHPDLEVEILDGNQPHYFYLISLE